MNRFHAVLLTVLLQGCFGDATCDSDHASVILAKSLSEERLATIYRDSERLILKNLDPDPSTVYAEFDDLEPVYAKRTGLSSFSIKLAGCYDHGTFLNIDTGVGEIAVTYGEGPSAGREILWINEPR